jgi:hypothetical protein
MRKMWEVSRIHSMKKGDEWVEKWKGERDEGRSTELRKYIQQSSIVRSHKRKPAEIHAHTVQLTSVKGRPRKIGVE